MSRSLECLRHLGRRLGGLRGRLPPVRLADLLRHHGMERRFDLLSIDTEGNELEVLESLELGEFTPRLIAVEIHAFEVATPERSPVYALLVGHGYRVVGYVRPTVFFALGEGSGLG